MRRRPRDPDVLIVGAGPAGSALAWHLARAGARVTLVDARRFPRSKACGECLSPGATPLLEEVGVADRLRRAHVPRLAGWRLRTPAGVWFGGRFGAAADGGPASGLAVSRRRLDGLLLDAALVARAELSAPLRVFDVRTGRDGPYLCARGPEGSARTLAARWIVGADGLRSVVARRIVGVRRGPRPRLAIVARPRHLAEIRAGTRPAPAMWRPAGLAGELRLSRSGCLGLAPIEEGRWNLTLVAPLTEARAVARDRIGYFRAASAGYGIRIGDPAPELAATLEITGPFQVGPRAVTAPGVLLVGDAAGYFDPLTGQGIFQALAGARLAAATILAALADPAEADGARAAYARALRRLVRPGRHVQRAIDATIRRPHLIEPLGAWLARRPGLVAHLLDVTGDRVPAGEFLSPTRLAAALRAPRGDLPPGPFGSAGENAAPEGSDVAA
ncbi:MAG: NAD(P)/FAD-dependent oxidoreductase [Gemmatimonadota bacterium]